MVSGRSTTLRRVIALTIAALLVVAFTAPAMANNGNGGNPNNDCDVIVSDGESIQDAIDNDANAGDTVCVEPGTYTENIVIDVPDLTLKSTDGAAETFVDPGGEQVGIQVLDTLGEVTVEGFTVLENWIAAGIVQGLGSREGTAFHVLNNVVMAPVETTQHGNAIQVAGDHSTVIGNTVAVPHQVSPNWAGSGILVFSASNAVVEANNVTSSPDDYCIAIAGDRFGAPAAINNQVLNNSVESCGVGILFQAGAHGSTAEGNVISDNSIGILIDPVEDDLVPTNNSVRFNDIVGNDVGIKNDAEGETLDATSNYWGHASGPSGPDGRVNPAGREVGKGDAIVGDVNFDNWLRQSISHPSRR